MKIDNLRAFYEQRAVHGGFTLSASDVCRKQFQTVWTRDQVPQNLRPDLDTLTIPAIFVRKR